MKMRTFTPALLAAFMLLTMVKSSGVFEVRLTSLSNDKGMTSQGECCQSDGEGRRSCREQCRTFVTICLMHYQNKIVRSYPSCTFGQFATPLLGGNNIDLREETGDGPYSVKLPFTFSWPKSFTLIIEVWHDEYGNQSIAEEKRILEVTKTGSAGPSKAWKIGQQGNYHAELTFAYRVVCDQNYYGDGCDRLCKARDDRFGHYVCSHNGTKLCLKGWTGMFCEQAVCHERCNLSHSFCDSPALCRCRLGWQGEYCEQCVKSPDCHHGFCYEPWQCVCHQGWTGINCDIDARFCEKRRPCKNGGTCRLDWTSNYTCECPRGFGGKDCQLVTCSDDICLNGGSCVEKASFIECGCRKGFHGERCEHVRLSCDDLVCQNNGTCTVDDSGRRCLCPVGFIGAMCEMDVHECMSSPCENGGTCVDEPGRFWCDCPPGFAGVSCEIIQDPCAVVRCENGGSCSEVSGVARCRCARGFTGDRCENLVQPCPPSRCANGGTCVADSTGTWMCFCRTGFKGQTCKTAVKGCHSPACKKTDLCKNKPSKCKKCSKDLLGGGNCQELRMSKEITEDMGRLKSVPVISHAEGSFHWVSTLSTILGCFTAYEFV